MSGLMLTDCAGCRVLFEMAIIITVAPWDTGYDDAKAAGVLKARIASESGLGPPESCPQWGIEPDCYTDGWVLAGSTLLMVCTGVYFVLYCICMARVHLQLSRQPYTAFRAANILYQLQVCVVPAR